MHLPTSLQVVIGDFTITPNVTASGNPDRTPFQLLFDLVLPWSDGSDTSDAGSTEVDVERAQAALLAMASELTANRAEVLSALTKQWRLAWIEVAAVGSASSPYAPPTDSPPPTSPGQESPETPPQPSSPEEPSQPSTPQAPPGAPLAPEVERERRRQ
jgi:hypothetical protein